MCFNRIYTQKIAQPVQIELFFTLLSKLSTEPELPGLPEPWPEAPAEEFLEYVPQEY